MRLAIGRYRFGILELRSECELNQGSAVDIIKISRLLLHLSRKHSIRGHECSLLGDRLEVDLSTQGRRRSILF